MVLNKKWSYLNGLQVKQVCLGGSKELGFILLTVKSTVLTLKYS